MDFWILTLFPGSGLFQTGFQSKAWNKSSGENMDQFRISRNGMEMYRKFLGVVVVRGVNLMDKL